MELGACGGLKSIIWHFFLLEVGHCTLCSNMGKGPQHCELNSNLYRGDWTFYRESGGGGEGMRRGSREESEKLVKSGERIDLC